MTPTPTPPDAAQTVADAWIDNLDGDEPWIVSRALSAALDALLTPAQVAYRAYVAALVAEDAARQVYDDTPYMDDYEAKVAWQCAIEAKFVAYAFWQAIEGQP